MSQQFSDDNGGPKVKREMVASASSLAGSTNVSVASTANADIRSFAIQRGLTANEIPTFHRLLLNVVVDTHNPFTFPKEPSVLELCEFLRPGSSDHAPSRFVVGGRLLDAASNEAKRADQYFISKAKGKGYLRSIAIDGWKDQSKRHIEGIVNMFGPESYLEPSEVNGSDHHGIAVAKSMEDIYVSRQDDLWSCVTDEAGQVSRAKRIIGLRYPHFLFNKCWAHQTNLMVNALLSLPEFKSCTDKACKMSNRLSASSAKWAVRFYDVVDDVYQKKTTLRVLSLGATRWNSAQAMFASHLRVKTAWRVFHAKWSSSPDWPTDFNPASDASFWPAVTEAELLIRVLCECSFILQCDGRTYADVVLILLNIYSHLHTFSEGESYAKTVFKDIEKRWNMPDQHLYLLGFAMHPKYRAFTVRLLRKSEQIHGTWTSSKNMFSVARLVMAAKFYYAKHRVWKVASSTEVIKRMEEDVRYRAECVREQCRLLGVAVKKWLIGASFDDGMTHEDFTGGHPVEFWKLQEGEHKYIACFAMWILSASIQSATCERLFKDYLQFHTPRRNTTAYTKVHKQAHVRRHIRRLRRFQEDGLRGIAGNHSEKTNRFVNPRERDFKDTHVQEDSTKNDEKVEEDEEDEEENSTSDSDKEQEDVDVNKWQAAIMQFAPDDAYDNNDESNEGLPVDEREQTTPVSEYNVDYYVNHLPPERCCEEVWTSPAPLPDDNEPDYPQENKAYFATKKEQNYVRNDRVTLERITSLAGLLEEGEHSGLPTLRSVYQDNVEVIREGW